MLVLKQFVFTWWIKFEKYYIQHRYTSGPVKITYKVLNKYNIIDGDGDNVLPVHK